MDSSNKERLIEAYNELAKLLQEKELKDATLLIFANKQVVKTGCFTKSHLKHSYCINQHLAINDSLCHVRPTQYIIVKYVVVHVVFITTFTLS